MAPKTPATTPTSEPHRGRPTVTTSKPQDFAPLLLGLLHFHLLAGRLSSRPERFGDFSIAAAERAFHRPSRAAVFQGRAAVGAFEGF